MVHVSVVIPTFNRFREVCEAVKSVQKQIYQRGESRGEIIVVDDGSTDDTPVEFPRIHPEVRYIGLSHSGLPAVARNAGLKAATGTYVAFLDSDDVWLPGKLDRQLSILDSHNEIGLVCSNALASDGSPKARPYLVNGQGRSGWVLGDLLKDNFIICSTVVVRRQILHLTGRFDEAPLLRALEDYDLWLRCAAVAEIYYLPEPLALYQNDACSSIRRKISRVSHWQGRVAVIENLASFVRGCGKEGMAKEAFVNARVACQGQLSKALWDEGRRLDAFKNMAKMAWFCPYVMAAKIWKKISTAVVGRLANRSYREKKEDLSDTEARGLRLHLGCGEVYLPGYVNIDYPPTDHTVQTRSCADKYTDLTQLSYQKCSVDEIRCHHVFEHFDRPTALRLLIDWYEWLKPGAQLILEMPDFKRSVVAFMTARTFDRQQVILRHLFGSHEAPWAIHKDGWYRAKLVRYLRCLGYGQLKSTPSKWQGTYNITVAATKLDPPKTRQQLFQAAEELLKKSLVGHSESERRLLKVWMDRIVSMS